MPAALAFAQIEMSGRSTPDEVLARKWKSEDGQELYELQATENSIHFERITPAQDRMYGESFSGAVKKAGPQYEGTAAAAVLQLAQGRATYTCSIQMSVTLTSVTPARIEGKARPERIDPACTPNNFSVTMTGVAFAWVPAAESEVALPQIQRRIEASMKYRRRFESVEQDRQSAAQGKQAELEQQQRPNRRLRGCEAALRQEYVVCSGHYPYTYPGRNYFPASGSCTAAQTAVDVSCY